jgi:hypothetical protein
MLKNTDAAMDTCEIFETEATPPAVLLEIVTLDTLMPFKTRNEEDVPAENINPPDGLDEDTYKRANQHGKKKKKKKKIEN